MRKFALSVLCCLCLGLSFIAAPTARASSPTVATVSAFVPATEEQYQRLSAPVDVWRDNDCLIVTDTQRISLYTFADNSYRTFDGLVANTGIARWGNFLFFISENKLKYVDYQTGTIALLNPEDVIACEAFTLYGDTLCCSQSKNTVLFFDLTIDGDKPVATKDAARSFSDANSLVCLTESDGEQVLYYHSDHYIFRKSQSGDIDGKRIDGDVRRMAANANVVYYTTPSGLYKLDFDGDEQPTSYESHFSADVSLLSFTAPFGIALWEGNLLVADSGNHAVQEFDPSANDGAGAFTGYAVTTFGDIPGRLSSNATDVAADETARYFADSGNKRLQIVSTETGDVTAIDLPFTPERVMPGDRYIFVSGQDGTSPVYALIDRKNMDEEVTPVADENVFSSIISTTYTDGYFYFATADLGVKQGKLFSLRESDRTLRVIYERNTPVAVASDVSGTVYYCYQYGAEIRMRVETQGDWTERDETQDVLLGAKPVKLQADFESNVYALQPDNTVIRYEKQSDYAATDVYSLALSENLAAQFATPPTAVSLAFNFASESVTVLYPDGFAGSTTQLDIATPLHIEVPADLGLLSPDTPLTGGTHPEIKKVCAGHNLYLFDLNELATDSLTYFPYKRFIRLTEDLTVIVSGYTGNYAVVAFADDSDSRFATALVPVSHLTDGAQPTAAEPQYFNGHTLTRVNGFKYPMIAEYFSVTRDETGSAAGLKKGEAVLLIGEYQITNFHLHGDGRVDGTYRYYDASFVFDGENVRAYLPATMVAQSLVEDAPTVQYRLQTVSPKKNGAISLYSDRTMTTELCTITKKTQVRVYSESDGVALVGYDDESGVHFGYLSADYVAANGKRTPVTVAVIMIFALSLTATAIFFLTRPKANDKE